MKSPFFDEDTTVCPTHLLCDDIPIIEITNIESVSPLTCSDIVIKGKSLTDNMVYIHGEHAFKIDFPSYNCNWRFSGSITLCLTYLHKNQLIIEIRIISQPRLTGQSA